MHTRRKLLGALGLAGAASLAGCSLVQGSFEADASPAGVDEAALETTGFEHQETEELAFERTVSALGQSRELRLQNWLVTYSKEAGGFGPEAARFHLFSTPSVSVAGTELNPLESVDDEELLEEAAGGILGDGDDPELERAGSRAAQVLGEDVQFGRYETEQSIGGQRVTGIVDVGRLVHDDDLLTIVGVHPAPLEESDNIFELVAAVEHPAAFE